VLDVQLDRTPPTLAPTVGPTPILLHGAATATPNAADAVSGLALQGCDTVDTSSAGTHVLTCTARDAAGNEATTPVTYLVQYKILGFLSPAANARLRARRTVPVQFALADANDVRIPDAEAQGLLSPDCRVLLTAT